MYYLSDDDLCSNVFGNTQGLLAHTEQKLYIYAEFGNLYYVVHNLIKECSKLGLGHVKSSEVISKEAEEKMWKTGILGAAQPKQLCKTVLYLLSLNLALHSGDEHKQLPCPRFNPQIEITLI